MFKTTFSSGSSNLTCIEVNVLILVVFGTSIVVLVVSISILFFKTISILEVK